MSVRKAVILAAGLGTRLLPATKAQPKELLPLFDTPIIQYTVEEAVASGLEQIIIVTGAGKRAVKEHFDRSPQLEEALQEKGDTARLDEVRRIAELADIVYVEQREQRGIGDAVLTAREAVGDEPFANVVDTPPMTKHTLGNNKCVIFPMVDVRTNRLMVVSCLDNLVKGAAGQAVQNMNLMLGFSEDEGLEQLALYP